jgi:S-adenosylmethionine:diacylglycerol 3-amino-3-carboxypropyl transferase
VGRKVSSKVSSKLTSEVTPWKAGRLSRFGRNQRLLFGATYEDPAIEIEALVGCKRVFCIAGAGDTGRALAAVGHTVTAVDINAAQVAYADARTNGAAFQAGAAERVMAIGRFAMKAGGWSTPRVRSFTRTHTIANQLSDWTDLTTGRGGFLLRLLLSPARLAAAFQPAFVTLVGAGFADRLIRTMNASLAHTPNSKNPFVRLLFLGEVAPAQGVPASNRPVFIHADAIAYLLSQPEGSFDGASLSNIGDGTTSEFHDQLDAALRHALKPDAPVVVRTLGDLTGLSVTQKLGTLSAQQVGPADADRLRMVQAAATTDRSLIWSGLEVQRA